MKISFDIDNTLVPYSDEFEVERSTSILNLISREQLRVGTKKLFNKLEDEKHEIWIYTTSFRPIWKLKVLFAKYGLYPKGFINQKINQAKLKQSNSTSSKNPKLFDLDLHIDDSEGVGMEGEKYGFDTVIVNPSDSSWANNVLKEVKRKQLNLDWQFKELIVTLIALKSNQEEQNNIYGYGDSTSEMIEDFFTYYDYQKANWNDLYYLNKSQESKLEKILNIIEEICKDKENDYWTNQSKSEDAKIIKGLSQEVLMSLGMENTIVEINHENEYDNNNNLIIQRTNTKLKNE